MAMSVEKPKLYPVNDETVAVVKEMENYLSGYVSIFRSIREHWIWEDPKKFQWWVDILMECNHADKKVPIGFELLDCKRGQTLHSLLEWSKRWRVDISTVRRFLKLLQSDSMIVTEPLSKTTRITVCNYDSYQQNRHDKDTLRTRDANATQTRRNTNNNANNDNKEDSTPPKDWRYSHNGFFDRQLKNNADEPELGKYQKLVEYLHEKDEDGNYKFSNVLSLEKQISYKDYIQLKEVEQSENKRSLKSVLEAMENKKTLKKDHKNVFLTAKTWLKMEFK